MMKILHMSTHLESKKIFYLIARGLFFFFTVFHNPFLKRCHSQTANQVVWLNSFTTALI